ncbi:MAG TPA: hypothetical protein VII99_05170, partial [Bacteroidia bacterium]
LAALEEKESPGARDGNGTTGEHVKQEKDFQLSFFQLNDPVLEQIRDEVSRTDINTLTPVEALMKLNEIKKLIGGK